MAAPPVAILTARYTALPDSGLDAAKASVRICAGTDGSPRPMNFAGSAATPRSFATSSNEAPPSSFATAAPAAFVAPSVPACLRRSAMMPSRTSASGLSSRCLRSATLMTNRRSSPASTGPPSLPMPTAASPNTRSWTGCTPASAPPPAPRRNCGTSPVCRLYSFARASSVVPGSCSLLCNCSWISPNRSPARLRLRSASSSGRTSSRVFALPASISSSWMM